MSDKNQYIVPFLVLKFGQHGLPCSDNDVIYVESSFTLKATFHNVKSIESENGIGTIQKTPDKENTLFLNNHYTSLFKQSVYWDWGDGTIVKGQSSTHFYSKPGRYKISCVLMDSDSQAYQNGFSIQVIVKEVIETKLDITEENTEDLYCGKIAKVASMECRLNNNVSYALPIIPYKGMVGTDPKAEEISFFDLKENEMSTKKRFYSFYDKENDNFFVQDYQKKTTFNPVKKYYPTYQHIFGFFGLKTQGAQTTYALNLATVITQPKVDDRWLSIKTNIQEDGNEDTPIRHYTSFEDMPSDYHYLGMRTFVDVYFKDDIPSEEAYKLSYVYDLETEQPFNELSSAANYTNMVPVKQEVIINSTPDDARLKYAFTIDTIIRDIENSADKYFLHSFVKNLTQPYYLVPYIEYNPEEFSSSEVSPFYYIPKDVVINDKGTLDIRGSEWKALDEEETPWLKKFEVSFRDWVQFLFKCELKIRAYVERQETIDLDDVVIPQQKLHTEDVKRLVDALTPNVVFDSAPLVKHLLYALLNTNRWLDKTITKMDNFYDDNNNPDRCYIPQLISFLRSLNEHTEDYQNDFGAVNEVNELTRILSMEHTDLVGHVNIVPLDIAYNGEEKAKNVGEEIYFDDILYVNSSGFIEKIRRNLRETDDNGETTYKEIQLKHQTSLIVWDTYTKISKIVSFYDVPKYMFSEDPNETLTPYQIKDYTEKWGWNLLLPERFHKTPMVGNIRKNVITGYYRFFLLNPVTQNMRVGNFVDEQTMVDPEFLSPYSWDSDWGCSYVFLLKLMHEKGLMLTPKEYEEDPTPEEEVTFTIEDEYVAILPMESEEEVTLKRMYETTEVLNLDDYKMFPHTIEEIKMSSPEWHQHIVEAYGESTPIFAQVTADHIKLGKGNTVNEYELEEGQGNKGLYPSCSVRIFKGSKAGVDKFYSRHKVYVNGNTKDDPDMYVYKEYDTLEEAMKSVKMSEYIKGEKEGEEVVLRLKKAPEEEPVKDDWTTRSYSLHNAADVDDLFKLLKVATKHTTDIEWQG